MDLKLKGKTAFISGSTAGIGFGVAKILLQEGASVIINGRTDESVKHALDKLKKIFPNEKIHSLTYDFAQSGDLDKVLDKLPEIDILINNVGIYVNKSFSDTTDEEWKDQMEVNLMSGVRLSRYLLPKMIDKNWGRIIFVSSECATLVPSDLIAYSTTKTAVLGVSRGLAEMTKGTDVTVNTVLPGSTMTERAELYLNDLAQEKEQEFSQVTKDFFKDVRPSSLLQRFASVEEIASTIVYFSSPVAAATNGAAIKLDGGSTGGVI